MTVIASIHPIAQKALADELRSDHRADVDSILALDSEAPMPRHPLDRQFLSFMIPGATQVMLSLTQLMETLKLTSNDPETHL